MQSISASQPSQQPIRQDKDGHGTLMEIPAGPFLMGSDKNQDPNAADQELPQH